MNINIQCFLIYSIIWLAVIYPSEQVSTECCAPNLKWVSESFCSDGSRFKLNCSAFFKADPENEESDIFMVDDTGSVLMFIQDGHSVPFGEFCTFTEGGQKKAFICFTDDEEENDYWRYSLVGIVSIISSFFLILTLIIYISIPELRDIQDKSMICAMTSLTISYLIIAIGIFRPNVTNFDYSCVTIAFILYFSFLTAFFWLHIVAFNVWRSVWCRRFRIKDDTLFAIFCLVGWGFPMCFLIAALTTHNIDGNHLKPRFGEIKCWFAGYKEMWVYFYGPVAILLFLNVIYLSLTSWRLWPHYKHYKGSELRTLKSKCALYIKLVFVMGITWIFEVLSSIGGWENDILWIPTDMLNALQGFIIFILLVVNRTKVKILLAKRKLFGIPFPKSWATQVDEEECSDVLPEEVELSRS